MALLFDFDGFFKKTGQVVAETSALINMTNRS